ncbi:Y-family DNA polymerase [Caenispirillum salinarum]|uniref:Y-family DNA polymerase n=1 Tax=Caenispirillum salinarum TaxID=859058 RepID=UPI00384AB8CD
MRRVISAWLPRFATDRWTRRNAAAPDDNAPPPPFALTVEAANTRRVHAADAGAEAAGIVSGMPLTDARAVFPALVVAEADLAADARALEALAEWCVRYTPWTAVDDWPAPGGGAGLFLDITGCAHLFGGEAAMLRDLRDRLRGFGFSARLGLADTKGAAWAAARFMASGSDEDDDIALLPEGSQRQLLMGLPVGSLRLAPAVVESLKRLGVRRVADLDALPRAPLAARLGRDVGKRLDQALGRAPEPFTPRAAVEPWRARIHFAEPIARTDDVEAATLTLCRDHHPRLEREGLGARRLLLELFRVDGTVLRRTAGTSRPARDPAHLARLFKEGLDNIDAGFGIESMALTLTALDPLGAEQTGFTRGAGTAPDAAERAAETARLLDRLRTRLGEANVLRPAPRESHIPEAAVTTVEASGGDAPQGWPPLSPRPARLFPRPEPLEPVEPAAHEGAPPAVFRWRRRAWRLAVAEGPERIGPEWWRTPGGIPAPSVVRDYWRAEDEAGHRLWLFRKGADWFVQGVFP